MNRLAIVGSPRKRKSTDTLVDKAIERVKSKDPNCNVKKINLIEHAKTMGDMYAGDIEHKGVKHYLDKAFKLGMKLV